MKPPYLRRPSGKTQEEVQCARTEYERQRKERPTGRPFRFTPPNYDAEYWAAMKQLDKL
jgi:hypothetical protein